MTTLEIAEYYANLLILQYANKERAYATVRDTVKPIIMDQLPDAVQNAYNIDTAVGVQLDILGKYVGASRNVQTFTANVTLTDDDFRLLIKVKILQNNSGSDLKTIQELIQVYFPTSLRVWDYKNMRMDYFFDSDVGSVDLAQAFVQQGYLPKPMGVQLGMLIYLPTIDNMFGFRTYNTPGFNVSPLNSYANYQSGRHFLHYADGI